MLNCLSSITYYLQDTKRGSAPGTRRHIKRTLARIERRKSRNIVSECIAEMSEPVEIDVKLRATIAHIVGV